MLVVTCLELPTATMEIDGPVRLRSCKACIRDALPVTETPTVQKKQCSKCHEEKTADQFDRYKRTADGLQSQCKVCMKVWSPLLSVRLAQTLQPSAASTARRL